MAGNQRTTELDRDLHFCTDEDDEHRKPLLGELKARSTEGNIITFQLMSQLGKSAHIGMRHCYEKYVSGHQISEARLLLKTKSDVTEILGELARIVGEDNSPDAKLIKKTNQALLRPKNIPMGLLADQIRNIQRYIEMLPPVKNGFSTVWIDKLSKLAGGKESSGLLPADFICFIGRLQTRLCGYVNQICSNDLPTDIETIIACAFLRPYINSTTDFQTLIQSVNSNNDDFHAIELEAENLLYAALDIETDLVASNSECFDYTQAGRKVEPSFFAARIALAALWLSKCPGHLTLRIVSAFFKKENAAVNILANFIDDVDSHTLDPVSVHVMKALFNAETDCFKLKVLTDYSNADRIHTNGSHAGNVNARCRAIFCEGHIDFLSAVYVALLNCKKTANTAQIALASKLAFACKRLPSKAYEPPSITPNSIVNGSHYDACKLLSNVFDPLISRLTREQGCARNPAIVRLVQKIYFANEARSIAQPGFNWTKSPKAQSENWLEIKSDDHLAKRRHGEEWGGPYLWLYGKVFADALENAIALTEASQCSHPSADQSRRLARFIFLVPKPSLPRSGVLGHKIYELMDYPLVMEEINTVVLALTRRIVRMLPELNLQSLYQPIYDSSHVIVRNNPFYGQTRASL